LSTLPAALLPRAPWSFGQFGIRVAPVASCRSQFCRAPCGRERFDVVDHGVESGSRGCPSRSVLLRRRPPCSAVSSAVASLSMSVPGRTSPRSAIAPRPARIACCQRRTGSGYTATGPARPGGAAPTVGRRIADSEHLFAIRETKRCQVFDGQRLAARLADRKTIVCQHDHPVRHRLPACLAGAVLDAAPRRSRTAVIVVPAPEGSSQATQVGRRSGNGATPVAVGDARDIAVCTKDTGRTTQSRRVAAPAPTGLINSPL
jgi:hypothetical protein